MSTTRPTTDRVLRTNVDRRTLLRNAGIAGAGAFAAGAFSRVELVDARQDATPGAAQGGTIVFLGHQEIPGLSPESDTATVPFCAYSQIHNALVEIDPSVQFIPVLAAEMPAISEDGLTYTFTLREGVTWQDGEPFTSEDVKYTYDWVMNPDNASLYAADFETVASVEAPDDLTVVVTLNNPNAAFMAQVGSKLIVPAHYHAEVGEEAYAQNPIGTGPFRLTDPANFNPTGGSTTLDAWDGHFRGRPNVDQVRFDIVPEPAVRAEALENGDADNSIWPLTPEDDQRLEESGDFTSFVTLNSAVNHFPLNNTHPILGDVNVRRAMMYAIDRQALIDDIFLGNAEIATSNLSPATGDFYTPDVTQYTFDPAQAETILDEAGWVREGDGVRTKDGEELTFTCYVISGDAARRPEAEVVQQYLADVGIQMELQEAPTTQILDGMRNAEYDAALFNWTYGEVVDPDATSTLASTGASNFSNYSNPRVDELLAAGLAETDREARIPIYHEIQRIVADEVPFLFIMFWNARTHFANRVQGLPDPSTVLAADYLYPMAYTFSLAEEE